MTGAILAALLAAGAAPDAFAITPAARDDYAVGSPAAPAAETAAETPAEPARPAAPPGEAVGRTEAVLDLERAERLVALATLRGAPAADLAIARARLRTARRALEENRWAEAADLARRAVETLEAAGFLEGAPADPPTTEAIFRAESLYRDRAAEGAPAWRLETARELIDAARGAAAGGDFTAAEDLAGRAAAILAVGGAAAAPAETAPPARRPPVDLNTATEAELATLPGMTPGRIRSILWWRAKMGPFVSPVELRFLPGFDSYYVLLLLERVTVGR